jgi:hypothetical protein
MNVPESLLAGFGQGGDKQASVIIIAENRLSVVATIHHVVYCAGD